MTQDSKERFTKHVDNYVKYRPGYPAEAMDCLLRECGLTAGSVVADVGAGTGKFTRGLLERGLTVYAVEPNDAMREAAIAELAGFDSFHAVKAAAEDTGLPDSSVDAVTAAQAFHWFDQARFKAECRRILKPGGKVALVWNCRDTHAPLMAAYEAVIQAHHDDMPNKTMRNVTEDEEAYRAFFADYAVHRFASYQALDYESLVGRALSSSYAPLPGHPQHEPLRAALRELFEQYQQDGQVVFTYKTEVIVGHV
jgi:ubiquinone/menaquinone biosynthesis C-methylase UbiE